VRYKRDNISVIENKYEDDMMMQYDKRFMDNRNSTRWEEKKEQQYYETQRSYVYKKETFISLTVATSKSRSRSRK